MCVYNRNIHNNVDNYTHKCRNTQHNTGGLARSSSGKLDLYSYRGPNLFARTVLCLLQSDSKAILAFMRGSCSMAWAHIALQTVKSVIKRSKTQESCHCPAGHTASQLMFFNTFPPCFFSAQGRVYCPSSFLIHPWRTCCIPSLCCYSQTILLL